MIRLDIDLLIRVASEVYGDGRIHYLTKCNIHFMKDANGQPAIDNYINELGAFFSAYKLDEVIHVELLIKGFRKHFDRIHNSISNQVLFAMIFLQLQVEKQKK